MSNLKALRQKEKPASMTEGIVADAAGNLYAGIDRHEESAQVREEMKRTRPY
jgi:hypothetical protein